MLLFVIQHLMKYIGNYSNVYLSKILCLSKFISYIEDYLWLISSCIDIVNGTMNCNDNSHLNVLSVFLLCFRKLMYLNTNLNGIFCCTFKSRVSSLIVALSKYIYFISLYILKMQEWTILNKICIKNAYFLF